MGAKEHAAIASEYRRLHVKLIGFLLIGENCVFRVLCLILIEVGGVKVSPAVYHKRNRLPGVIRDLKVAVITAQHQNESTRIVDDIREVIEGLKLIGIVVDRIAAARWIFDAYAVVEITSRHVVSQPSADTTVFEARHDGVEAPNLDRGLTTGELRSCFSVNIDHPGSPESKLRRQCAGN